MDEQHLQLERTSPQAMDAVQQRRLMEEFHLQVAQNSGCLQLSLRPGRQKGLAVVTLLIGVVLLALAGLTPDLIRGVLPDSLPGIAPSTDAVRLAVVGFGISLLLLSLYLPFNGVDVQINRRKIRRIRRWFGLTVAAREVRSKDVRELTIDSLSTGSAGGADFALVGVGRFGDIRLIDHISDPALMEALRRQVTLAAGLRPSGTY